MANIWHRASSPERVSRQELVKRSEPPRHEDTETSCLGAVRLHRGMSAGFGRTEDWHGVSPIGAAALPQIVQGFVRQRIETARGGIFLNLAVPPSSVELGEPRPERGEFRGGKSANGILDLSNRAHVTKLTPLDRPAQPPWFLSHMGTIVDTGFLRRAW